MTCCEDFHKSSLYEGYNCQTLEDCWLNFNPDVILLSIKVYCISASVGMGLYNL